MSYFRDEPESDDWQSKFERLDREVSELENKLREQLTQIEKSIICCRHVKGLLWEMHINVVGKKDASV
jgi:hypothetical protein